MYGAPNGAGMKIVHGDRDQLATLVASDEYRQILIKVQHVADDWDFDIWLTGEAMDAQLDQWMAIGKEMGLVR